MEKTLAHAIGSKNIWTSYMEDGVERAYCFSLNSAKAGYLAGLIREEVEPLEISGIVIQPIDHAGVLIDAPVSTLRQNNVFNDQKDGPDKNTFIIRAILQTNRLWRPHLKAWEESKAVEEQKLYDAFFVGNNAELLLQAASHGTKENRTSVQIMPWEEPEYIAAEHVRGGEKACAKITATKMYLQEIGVYDHINHIQGAFARRQADEAAYRGK